MVLEGKIGANMEHSDSSEHLVSDSSDYVDASGATSVSVDDIVSCKSSDDDNYSIKRTVDGGSTLEETSPI
jgi:hypothetical protein